MPLSPQKLRTLDYAVWMGFTPEERATQLIASSW